MRISDWISDVFSSDLLHLLSIIITGVVRDLRPERIDTPLDHIRVSGAVDDGRCVLVDRDTLGLSEHVQRHGLELYAEILGDEVASGKNRNISEHRLAPIAEPRRLDGGDVQAAAQLVDDERGERLPLNVFGDDEQGSTRLNHRFQDREQRMESTELLDRKSVV